MLSADERRPDPAVELFAPNVKFVSTPESQFDAMMTWRAELELQHFAGDDTPAVLGGYAEFFIIRVGEHPIADLLDSLSQDAEHFAGLFYDDDVDWVVQDQFEAMPLNQILIVSLVLIAEPLRGHDLGLWLLAEIIARMGSATDTLVLLYPYPAVEQTGDSSELAAVNALTTYWQRAGLEPIATFPEFLGQSTAYQALTKARAELEHINHVSISVDPALIQEETAYRWTDPRQTLVAWVGSPLPRY